MWAAGPRDAWAAGESGVLLHWDGAAWSPAKSGVKEALTSLWGDAAFHRRRVAAALSGGDSPPRVP